MQETVAFLQDYIGKEIADFNEEDWEMASEIETLSKDFIACYIDKLDWRKLLINNFNLDEEMIRTFQDKMEWNDWNIVSNIHDLSEGFIREFADKLNWFQISDAQDLSESLIEDFSQRLDWAAVSKHQKLSFEFVMRNLNRIDLEALKRNEHLMMTEEQRKQLDELSHLQEAF